MIPSGGPNIPSQFSRLDRVAERVLQWPLACALALLCAYQLLTWLPHYVGWPWWPDHDVFASAALAWDAGILPYRDFHLNNFPGTIYLFWILGRIFGWNQPPAFYAMDGAFVVALGLLLAAWSRAQFGRLLPGLAAYSLFLSYYLGLSYALTAQRDWHAPFFIVAALIVLQTWPGRTGWISGGVLTALAFSIRPQIVLFVPALLLALDQQVREPGESWRRTVGASAVFALSTAGGVVALFMPLVNAGVFGDFLDRLATLRLDGEYSVTSLYHLFRRVILTATPFSTVAIPLALALLRKETGPRIRRTAAVWMTAYAGALLYLVLSPRAHLYLRHPIMLIWACVGAVLIAAILDMKRMGAGVQLALVVLVLGLGVSIKPQFSNVGRSLEALRQVGDPAQPPLGYTSMGVVATYAARYDWPDYVSLLDYVRRLPSTVRVANVLYGVPAIAGATGHISAFPAESISAITISAQADEQDFVDALLAHPDTVVVWSPSEVRADRPRLPRLVSAIERNFRLDRAFGKLEVWRRVGVARD